MTHLKIITDRLELVAGTPELARADMEKRSQFSQILNARVPLDWPPPLNDADSMAYAANFLEENPDAVGWGVWYFILHGTKDRIVIGNGGFKGQPALDGTVEVGYSIVEEFQGVGYGSEAVKGLVFWAFDQNKVKRVIAETLPELTGSIRVLEKNGFTNIGDGSELGVIRFELQSDRYEQINRQSKI